MSTKLEIYSGSCVSYQIGISGLTLTGSESAWFTIKTSRSIPDSLATIQKTIGAGLSFLSLNPAALLLTLSQADTGKLAPGETYVFDVQIMLSSGELGPLVSGSIKVFSRVTHAPLTT